jgi:hypothetical protein
MKHLLWLIFFFPTMAFGQEPNLKAGAAAVEVTPKEFPLNMPGGFGPNLAEKAHDPLFARALVLDDGKLKIALVLVDNLGLAAEVVEEAKLLASRKCGILPEQMLISATHTHSGPPSNVLDGPKEAVAYRKVLVEGIAEVIVQAHANLRPALLGASSHPLPDEVFNRRWFVKPNTMSLNPFGEKDIVRMNPPNNPETLLHPAGPTDPEVSVLSVIDAKTNRPLCIYANYSLHYVGGTPAKEVSADYFGEFARLMPIRLGLKDSSLVAMLTNGTSGDINNIPFNLNPPRPPRETFEQIRIVAGKTADAVWHARNKIGKHQGNITLAMRQREITLKVRKPSEKMLERANQILNLKDDGEKRKFPPLSDVYAQRTLSMAKSPDTIKVPLQVVRIGDLLIGAIPFETFVEIGLDLKRRSPMPRTFIVGLANGYNGYLPTPEQHKLGGYETWLGTNRVEEEASVRITETLLELMKQVAR